MEANLQEAINKLPVIQKAHIYEPKIEDVAEIAYEAGETGVVKWLKAHNDFNKCPAEIGVGYGLLIQTRDWQTFLKEKGIDQPE